MGVTKTVLDWFLPERMILTKNIKEKNFDDLQLKIKSYLNKKYPENEDKLIFSKSKLANGKKRLNTRLPIPFGFGVAFEDGKIVITDKIFAYQQKELVHLFHYLGIENFTFAHETNKDFASDFQNAWNDEITGIPVSPKFETKSNDKYAKSSVHAGIPINQAEKVYRSFLKETGKREFENVKFRYLWNGDIIAITYPNANDMKESGRITKDGRVQKWDSYMHIKRTKDNGVEFLFANNPDKGMSEDHAAEIADMAKSAGYSHIVLGPNLTRAEKGNIMKGFAKKQIIPIIKPDVPILYKVFLEGLDAEVAKGQMDTATRLALKTKLLNQIKKNTIDAIGKEIPEEPRVKVRFDALELDIIKENLAVNQTLKSATDYDGDKISNIMGLIDTNKEMDSVKKMQLKAQLLVHIKTSYNKKITKDRTKVDGRVEKWIETLDVLIKVDDLYTKKLYPEIEKAINANDPDANDIYSTVKAVAQTLTEYKQGNFNPAFNYDTAFKKALAENKTSFDSKMTSYAATGTDDFKMERKIKNLTSLASSSLSNIIDRIKTDYPDVKFDNLFVPKIVPPSEYNTTPPAPAPRRMVTYRSSGSYRAP